MTPASPVAAVAVVGGGITGLCAARALLSCGGAVRVVLIEAEPRLGGKILTRRLEGGPIEAGPDALVTRVPWATSLCAELGLGDQLVPPEVDGASLWSRGHLRRLPSGLALGFPTSPLATLRSRALSVRGAMRASADLVLPPRLPDTDTSVGALVRYRLGRQVLERLVEPLLGGVHAGRADELSLRATAPHVEAVARNRRSLILGLRAAMGRGSTGAAKPALVTVRGGLGRMVEALERRIAGANVVLGRSVKRLQADATGGYFLDLGDETITADAVVLAVPAFAAAETLGEMDRAAAAELAQIDYSSISTVTLVYPPQAGSPPSGVSGFLVPPVEQRVLKGCSFVSAKWPHLAAPDGGLVLRCAVGGIEDRSPTDDELVAAVTAELRDVIGLTAQPRAWTITRWPRALPHYTVGHLERLERIRASLPPTVAVAGAAYGGVGIPDCIRQGEEAAARVLDALGVRVTPDR